MRFHSFRRPKGFRTSVTKLTSMVGATVLAFIVLPNATQAQGQESKRSIIGFVGKVKQPDGTYLPSSYSADAASKYRMAHYFFDKDDGRKRFHQPALNFFITMEQTLPAGYAGGWFDYPEEPDSQSFDASRFTVVVLVEARASAKDRKAMLKQADPALRPHLRFFSTKYNRAQQTEGLKKIRMATVQARRKGGFAMAQGYDVWTNKFKVSVNKEDAVERLRAALPDDLRADTIVTYKREDTPTLP